MLLAPDKKKLAMIIVSKAKPDYVQGIDEKSDNVGKMDFSEAESEDEMAPKVVAARAVLKAFEAKSAKALAKALYQFYEVCEEHEAMESPEEEALEHSQEY